MASVSYFPLTAGAYPVPVCPCSPRRIRRIHVAVSIRNRHRTTSLRSALLLLPEEPAVSFLHLTRGVRAALQPERRDSLSIFTITLLPSLVVPAFQVNVQSQRLVDVPGELLRSASVLGGRGAGRGWDVRHFALRKTHRRRGIRVRLDLLPHRGQAFLGNRASAVGIGSRACDTSTTTGARHHRDRPARRDEKWPQRVRFTCCFEKVDVS